MTERVVLFVNRPGGVIVHMEDGETKNLAYGSSVPEGIASYVDVSKFADNTARGAADAPSVTAEAHRRAALAENGQINSGSSPVPGNYAELDEDTAAQLVRGLARYPESQASILVHETLFAGNRQRVHDAAGEYARIASATRLAQMKPPTESPHIGVAGPGLGDVDQNPGDPGATARIEGLADDAVAGLKTPGPSGAGGSSENLSWDADSVHLDQLKAYTKQHSINTGGATKKADIIQCIIDAGHAVPETPLPPHSA